MIASNTTFDTQKGYCLKFIRKWIGLEERHNTVYKLFYYKSNVLRMYYDYIIVGLGPSGITTALHLAKTKAKLLLIEADYDIGGCWKSHYHEELFLTEHSPKVLFSHGNKHFKRLLKQIDVNPEYKKVYASNFVVMMSIIYYVLISFDIGDYYHTIKYSLAFLLGFKYIKNDTTVEQWCEKNNISEQGRNIFNLTTITINGTRTSQTKMYNLFKFLLSFDTLLAYSSIVQMSEPKQWLLKCKTILQSYPNVKILTNTHAVAINSSPYEATSIRTSENKLFIAQNYVLCVPLRKLFDIVQNSSLSVQKNWFTTLHDMKQFVDVSSYTGFGIQFHFLNEIKEPNLWCWSCTTEWNIIVVNKSLTLKHPSFDKRIKTVWSCVVCDFKALNECGKTINHYDTKQTVAQEVLRQISYKHGAKLSPALTTFNANIHRCDNKWKIHESSFTNVNGALNMKGNLPNLFSIGPHNMDEIVVIDSAIKSALIFCKTHGC